MLDRNTEYLSGIHDSPVIASMTWPKLTKMGNMAVAREKCVILAATSDFILALQLI